MAETAERVIVELLAKVDGFDGKVRQSAAQFGKSMDKIASDATGAEAAAGRALNRISTASLHASTQMSRGFSDVSKLLVGANSPFVVPVKQAAPVAAAMGVVKSAGTALAGMFGGALVGGVALAGAALLDYILKSRNAGDSTDDLVAKLKEKATQDALVRAATEAYNQTLEAQIDIQRRLREEIERGIVTERIKAQEQVVSAQAVADRAKRELAEARRSLAEARSAQAAIDANPQAGGGVAGSAAFAQASNAGAAAAAVAAAEERVKTLQRQVRETTLDVRVFANALTSIDSAAAADPIKEINARYDDMQTAARRAADSNDVLSRSLRGTLDNIERLRKAEVKREQDRQAAARNDRQSGRQIDFDQATSIARSAGLQVNSGYRSNAQQAALYNNPNVNRPGNPVAPPGSSAHNVANGKWGIDIQITDGVTAGKIRKIYADQGVNLTKVLREKGHFHVEGSRSEAAQGENTAARAAEQEANRQQRQTNILSGLSERYADALAKLAAGTEDSAEAQKAAIETERANDDARIKASKDLDATAKAEAVRLNNATAALAVQLVDRAESERKFREVQEQRQRELSVTDALNQHQQDTLREQAGLARTQSERRDIELKILALAIEEERLRAEAVIAARDDLKARMATIGFDKLTREQRSALADADAQATIAQDTLNGLPGKQTAGTAQINRATAGPLQQLFDSLPQSAEEVSEAFEAIAAHGLDGLADGITDAITGAKSLGEAFSGVAQSIIRDLVAMTVKALIFKAVSSAFGFSGGGPVSGGSQGFTGPPGEFATGGHIRGPGSGTSDSIPAMLSNGEFVIKSASVKKFGTRFLDAINDGRVPGFSGGGLVTPSPNNASIARVGGSGASPAPIVFDLRGAVMTEDLLRQMNRIATERSAQAGRASFDSALKAMPDRLETFRKLGS